MAMRYMTTSGFQRLTPFEFSGTASEVVKELPQMIVPPMAVPAYIEDIQKNVLTAEQLHSMAAHVEGLSAEERKRLDMIQEEMGEGVVVDSNGEQMEQMEQLDQMEQMNAMAALRPLPVAGLQDGFQDELPMDGQIIGQAVPNANPQNQVVYPMSGGLPLPALEGTPGGEMIGGASVPGAGPMIAVRTDRDAFERDGIYLEGGNRPIRRNVYRNPMGQMGQMQRMGTPMSAMMQRFAPMDGGQGGQGQGSSQTVTVVKLE